jgi:hypothetical protein
MSKTSFKKAGKPKVVRCKLHKKPVYDDENCQDFNKGKINWLPAKICRYCIHKG